MITIFRIKAKSEDYLLHRMMDEVLKLNGLIKNLYKNQTVKANINKKLVQGIKKEGKQFTDKLASGKTDILAILNFEKEKLERISSLMAKLEHQLNLLIHMEQASLVLHTDRKRDDLSDMIDVHSTPIEKFTNEIEHIKMLNSSFDILKVELEKQKEYISNFDLDENTLDEQYFHESEKLESKLSEEEIVSVAQLKEFCLDLQSMIRDRLESTMPFISESDKVALQLIAELKKIKISTSIFSPSLYSFIQVFISQIMARKHKRLIVFLLLFLLSRLKKFCPDAYYQQLRTSILCYNLLGQMYFTKSQRFIISGAMLMSNMSLLETLKGTDDEAYIIKDYFKTANQLFNEELVFVDSLLTGLQGEKNDTALPWITNGARVMKLIYDFDAEVTKCVFKPDVINAKKEKIAETLLKDNENCQEEIVYLLQNWERLITKSLAVI